MNHPPDDLADSENPYLPTALSSPNVADWAGINFIQRMIVLLATCIAISIFAFIAHLANGLSPPVIMVASLNAIVFLVPAVLTLRFRSWTAVFLLGISLIAMTVVQFLGMSSIGHDAQGGIAIVALPIYQLMGIIPLIAVLAIADWLAKQARSSKEEPKRGE